MIELSCGHKVKDNEVVDGEALCPYCMVERSVAISKEEQQRLLDEIRIERGMEVLRQMKVARYGDDGEGM